MLLLEYDCGVICTTRFFAKKVRSVLLDSGHFRMHVKCNKLSVISVSDDVYQRTVGASSSF